ncbi:MAG TPA: RagB/SusD family nutrient uptake outer membrane protein [Gemmatimonadaceae bacterium]
MKTKRVLLVALAGALSSVACKGFLEVTNPGPINDSALYTPDAVPALVVGMSSDYSNILDEIARISSIAGDESGHGGSYTPEQIWVKGVIRPEDMNGLWGGMHQVRFESESGIVRMKAMTGFAYDKSALAARANMFAGMSNRMLGETTCEAVFDSGPAQDYKVYFSRAEAYFTEAIRIASAVPTATDILNASYAGRAAVRVAQGNWAGAVADATLVPASFVYLAYFATTSFAENNSYVQETYVRREFSVFGSQWAQVFKDPRVPWDTIKTSSGAIQTGQDGITKFFRQAKYKDLGADIPMAKGAEMLMIRAENALRGGDIAGAFTFINQQRAVYAMAPLTAPADVATAWPILEKEKGAVLWLEGRRLGDLRRWYLETGPAHNAFLEGRDKCLPISLQELQTNPNLRGRLP